MVRVDSLSGWAVLCGIVLGVGLWSLVSLVPRLGRPGLAHRVAPYLVDVSPGARRLLARRTVDPLPAFGALLWPLFGAIRNALSSALGGSATTELRLRQSASTLSVESFRSRQLIWALSGLILGVCLAVGVSRSSGLPFIISVALVILCGFGGVVGRDRLLQRAAVQRLRRITSELPTVLEFLTLSLSAGEGVLDALRRVGRVSKGELAAELSGVVSRVNTGVPFAEALMTLATSVRLPALTRCIEQIVGALERGSPLAEVLRAQAQDARDDAKRELLEVAGKKETAMMVPLVFLILPVTIVFAIFPGLFVLQYGI